MKQIAASLPWSVVLLCGALFTFSFRGDRSALLIKNECFEKERRKPIHKLIPLNLDGYMFTAEWDLGVLANEIRSRVAADFRGWEKRSTNFDKQVDRVIKALRADEGAREPPPPSRL